MVNAEDVVERETTGFGQTWYLRNIESQGEDKDDPKVRSLTAWEEGLSTLESCCFYSLSLLHATATLFVIKITKAIYIKEMEMWILLLALAWIFPVTLDTSLPLAVLEFRHL